MRYEIVGLACFPILALGLYAAGSDPFVRSLPIAVARPLAQLHDEVNRLARGEFNSAPPRSRIISLDQFQDSRLAGTPALPVIKDMQPDRLAPAMAVSQGAAVATTPAQTGPAAGAKPLARGGAAESFVREQTASPALLAPATRELPKGGENGKK